jgi:ADP-ribosylglycohydrolase
MGNTQNTQLRSDQQSEVKMKNQPIFESEEVPPLTIAQMDSLLEFLPIFTAEGVQAGVEVGPEPLGDSTFTSPYWKYHGDVDRFAETMYEKGVITPFNYPDWMSEAHRYWENPEAVAEADSATLRKLLIVFARGERFCEGHWAEMFRIGHIAAILKRIAALRAETPASTEEAGHAMHVAESRLTSGADKPSSRRSLEHFTGCLLGGAVGDALGAPVEFHSIHAIRSEYGSAGIMDYDAAYGRRGAITDDTQMTLFTAEGMLRAITRRLHKGISHPASMIHHAYIRWLRTQGERSRARFSQDEMDGWLIGVKGLHSRRAPGNTCLSALRGEEMGEMQRPLNDSKGCGGVMRVAPVGLVAEDEEQAFSLGCESAAITHGHPSGYYSAGCFAAIINHLMSGRSLPEAIELALRILERPENDEHEECAAAVRQAVAMWRGGGLKPSPEVIERLGGGWVGEEALAISLYCALSAQDDFARGVLLAVNHSGDSDSTGAITGNLLGLMLGVRAIPEKWLSELELRTEIEAVAGDLFKQFEDTDAWRHRYPG